MFIYDAKKKKVVYKYIVNKMRNTSNKVFRIEIKTFYKDLNKCFPNLYNYYLCYFTLKLDSSYKVTLMLDNPYIVTLMLDDSYTVTLMLDNLVTLMLDNCHTDYLRYYSC